MTNRAFLGIIKCVIYLLNELKMYLLGSKIHKVLLGMIGISLIFLAFLYSDNIMVGFSDFKFLSGAIEVNTLNLEITGGDTTGFSVVIYNQEETDMTYKLGFVDAGKTSDVSAQPACFGQNETGIFGQYITGDTSFFTIPTHSSVTKTLSMKFPVSYSGVYHGCIMFFPTLTPLNTITGSSNDMPNDANTLPRRGGFIDVLVHSTVVPITVKAFPSNRVYQATNNENRGIVKFYSLSKQFVASSDIFELNSAGTGEALVAIAPGTYYVVFKGQSHIASYLSGVLVVGTGGDFFDFTTGANLFGTQNLDSQTNDGKQYQTAGDLKSSVGLYDYIVNGNDISIIITSFPQSGVDSLEPRNLNGDTEINSSDIGIIGSNFLKTDSFFGGLLFIWQ